MKLGVFTAEQVDALCLHHLRGGMKPREICRVLDVSVRRAQVGLVRARRREKLGIRVIPPTPENVARALVHVASHPRAKAPPRVPATPMYGCKGFTPATTCADIHPRGPIPEGSHCYCERCGRHGMDGLHHAVPRGVRPLPVEPRAEPKPAPKFRPKSPRTRGRICA